MTYTETTQRVAQGYFDLVSRTWEESQKLLEVTVEAGIENMKDSLRAATEVQERLIEAAKEARDLAAQTVRLPEGETAKDPSALFQKATALYAEGAQKAASVGLANAKTFLGLAETTQARLVRVNREAAQRLLDLGAKVQGIFSTPQAN